MKLFHKINMALLRPSPIEKDQYCSVKTLQSSYWTIHLFATICLNICMNHFKVKHSSFPLIVFNGYIFSSPEHKVLRVSYCDRPLSVVRRRASCVVRKLFYLNISFWNHSLDFDQTSQEWPLGGPLPKLFKWFWLVA